MLVNLFGTTDFGLHFGDVAVAETFDTVEGEKHRHKTFVRSVRR